MVFVVIQNPDVKCLVRFRGHKSVNLESRIFTSIYVMYGWNFNLKIIWTFWANIQINLQLYLHGRTVHIAQQKSPEK